jgi:hypothetical protein
MSQISRRDILGPSSYAPIRDDYRKRIIQLKKPRRVVLGERVSLVFENRDTLSFQIEEMLRAEHITDEQGIAQEIEIYNSMMPDASSLTATLFLEIPRDEGLDVRAELGKFIGIDEHLHLLVGEHDVRAEFEAGRQEDDRISAVQYTRFPLPPEARAALAREGTPLAIAISHPNYRVRVELPEETRQSLARDLA